ncbi:MAG: PH domain-containing protein [Actinobacteria bacterium]|nr:PH domain-containing protein [Actinomycetota bacterium]
MRDAPTGRLDMRVVTSWRLSNALWTVLLDICIMGAALTFSSVMPDLFPKLWVGVAALVSLILLVLFVLITPSIHYARWRYAVNEDDIDIMRGIIIYKRIIIPLVRVQHVDSKQGPILRMLKLASVSVATAAGEHEIPGLALEEADALRDRVAVLARIAQEDV